MSKHLTITFSEQQQTITSQTRSKHKTITLCEQQQTVTSQNEVKTLNHHTLCATTNNNITK